MSDLPEEPNPDLRKEYIDLLRQAMVIDNQKDADLMFDHLSDALSAIDEYPLDITEQIVKLDLGYFAGYYDHQTRIRVEKLFNCVHPFFGSAEAWEPTPEEAYQIGKASGMGVQEARGQAGKE